ncbi:MAG: hypothetical protein DMD34_02835 [Gemmatimonadetes bacterium]|nr:MAG: hypothetical protein DMD34_02835 [Gemmatimonadota bacterium]
MERSWTPCCAGRATSIAGNHRRRRRRRRTDRSVPEAIRSRSRPLRRRRQMSDKPSRNEEEYFAKRSAELLRQQRDSIMKTAAEVERRAHYMKCPKCGYDLITGEWHGVQIDQCTHCHGLWFDAGQAESLLADPHPNMFARVFRAVLRGVSGAKASDV